MSLPITANRTPATNARVARADILGMQDCQVARYQRRMATQHSRTIPAMAGRSGTATWLPIAGGLYKESGGAGTLILPLELAAGTRFFQVSARMYGGGGGTLAVAVYRRQHGSAAAAASVYSGSGTSSGAWTTIASSVNGIGHIMEEGWRYWLRVTAGQTGDRCLWGRVLIDRP